MELRPTSTHPELRGFFESLRDQSPDLQRCGQMMLDLVCHLEDKVDAPPVWVYTRWPGELLFYSDVKFAVRASVNAYPRAMSQLPNYEIRYALEPPWTWATGYANSLEEATLMVLHALQHSYKNGQQTKKRYRTRTKKAP